MTTYLGPAGSLQVIKDPIVNSGLNPNVVRLGSTKQTLGGGSVRHTVAYKKRITLAWTMLTRDEYGVLEGLYVGAYGPGPHVFVDPEQRNLLTANQSSGTDALQTTDGFTLVSGSQIVSSAAYIAEVGYRNLRWDPTATGQIVLLGSGSFAGPSTGAIVPVVAGNSYSFSARLKYAVASASVHFRLYWYGASGLLSSATTAGADTSLSTAYQSLSVIGTAPAGAYSVRAALLTSTTTAPSASAQVLADSLQLEQASAPSPWVPGTGVPQVFIDSLTRVSNIPGYIDAQMTLVEV